MSLETHPFVTYHFEIQDLEKKQDKTLWGKINLFTKELWLELHFEKWKNDFKKKFQQEIKTSFHYE